MAEKDSQSKESAKKRRVHIRVTDLDTGRELFTQQIEYDVSLCCCCSSSSSSTDGGASAEISNQS